MRQTQIFLAFILGALSLGMAEACKGKDGKGKARHHMPMNKFFGMDADNDNKVTLTEFNQFHQNHFTEMDVDKNSELSLEEIANFFKSKKEK